MPVFHEKQKHIVIQIETDDDWGKFHTICEGFITHRDFNLIRDYLKGSVKTIVLEKDYVDADYRDTFYNFFSRKFAQYPSKTIRVNLFTCKISPQMLFKLDRFQDAYIGFIVLRPNRITSIGRTILDPEKLSFIAGHICVSKYPVHILGAELTAIGFPYMSQDTDVTICAHAACWMIFRYFSQRYTRYSEKWPYEVTQLTKDVSTGRLVPSKGLTAYQVTEMFSNFGFSPEIYTRSQYPDLFDKLLYIYVESGLPVVAALSGYSHAITIIGHTSDFEIPTPMTPNSSDTYLTGLIANDDNFMPYHGIRKDNAIPAGYWSRFKISDIDTFIVPLYEKIHLSAEHVVTLSNAILTNNKLGIDSQSSLIKYGETITRIFLTSSKSFKKTRKNNALPFGISDVYCEMAMPKFVWVCEISTPDLYKKGQIVGELLFDATANHHDRFAFLSIHYPDFLLLNDRDSLTDDPRRFSIHRVDTTDILPYLCYINNLCEV
ncbi:MAG: papain-like cysteine protease family protein [Pseudomonadota bacterium]